MLNKWPLSQAYLDTLWDEAVEIGADKDVHVITSTEGRNVLYQSGKFAQVIERSEMKSVLLLFLASDISRPTEQLDLHGLTFTFSAASRFSVFGRG